jgi:hypothetical protein
MKQYRINAYSITKEHTQKTHLMTEHYIKYKIFCSYSFLVQFPITNLSSKRKKILYCFEYRTPLKLTCIPFQNTCFYENKLESCIFLSVWSNIVFCFISAQILHVRRVPATTAWRFLRSWVEGQTPATDVSWESSNKQPWTDDKGWYSSLGVGREANNPSP